MSWIIPLLPKVWASSFGKLLLTLLHGLIRLLAIVLARTFVAEALGLRPQDLDLTVSIWAPVLYLPLWTLFISILMLSDPHEIKPR